MKISNSKKQLAKIISENGGWIAGAKFAAQDKQYCGRKNNVALYDSRPPRPEKGEECWGGLSGAVMREFEAAELLPNWHQTILSRDEYFHLYPAPDADGWIEWKGGACPCPGASGVARRRDGQEIYFSEGEARCWSHDKNCIPSLQIVAYRIHEPAQSVERICADAVAEAPEHVWTNPPTIEQLAAEYRNRKDYAERKQQEADAAKVDADARLAKLVTAGKALGLVLSVAAPEPELAITDWRDLQVGDEIKVFDFECPEDNAVRKGELMGGVCVVMSARDGVVHIERKGNLPNKGLYWNATGADACKFTFIRRPSKGADNA